MVDPIVISTFTHQNPKVAKNFGDAVSRIFWENLSQKAISIKEVTKYNKSPSYITIGSILKLSNKNSKVLGTGFICEKDDLGTGKWGVRGVRVDSIPKEILCVRGPLTRKKLNKMGVNCPEVYGDPLILLPLIYNKPQKKRFDVGILPHYIDYNCSNVKKTMNRYRKAGRSVTQINILTGENYQPFIDRINECEYIVSSSLHGVIMGVVYGKKTIWVNFSDKVFGKGFKFHDFLGSIGNNYKRVKLGTNKMLQNHIKCDLDKLKKVGTDIINATPFIEDQRKETLIQEWTEYCIQTF